ncbi:MAG: ZIP family metal transporter [Planctomycetes bacterium]|nr:ZIP family metal transporter [Planctomycetota bacterium]MCC7172423.1 ZIP family metal transporter [Planctomycetota bacterium]
MIQTAISIFAVALIGGCLPLMFRWSDRVKHSILALSAGIFLGAVFLHLLPELSALEHEYQANLVAEEAQHDAAAPATSPTTHDPDHSHFDHAHGHGSLWYFVLLGVLGVYLTEALLLRHHHHDEVHRHRTTSLHALLGLSIHSFTNGIGLGVNLGNDVVAQALFISIIAHKSAEAFSLTTLFQLASFKRLTTLLMLVPFCAVTPTGMFVGHLASTWLGPYGIGVLTALASGTFLFVCLCELLPEVFHHREDSLIKLVLLAAGIGLMGLIHEGCA